MITNTPIVQTLAEQVAAIGALGRRMVRDAPEIGRHLKECKRIAGHGNWLPWLKREFGWSEATALNYIQAYDPFGSNSERFPDLSLRSLYLLAAPSTPDTARNDVLKRTGAGEKTTYDQAQAILDRTRRRPTGKPTQAPVADPSGESKPVALMAPTSPPPASTASSPAWPRPHGH